MSTITTSRTAAYAGQRLNRQATLWRDSISQPSTTLSAAVTVSPPSMSQSKATSESFPLTRDDSSDVDYDSTDKDTKGHYEKWFDLIRSSTDGPSMSSRLTKNSRNMSGFFGSSRSGQIWNSLTSQRVRKTTQASEADEEEENERLSKLLNDHPEIEEEIIKHRSEMEARMCPHLRNALHKASSSNSAREKAQLMTAIDSDEEDVEEEGEGGLLMRRSRRFDCYQ